MKSSLKILSLSLATLALTSCGAGNGSPPSSGQPIGQQPGQYPPGTVLNNPGPAANGNLAPIPAMNFNCGPNCVSVSRSRWNPVKSLGGKRFDIAILSNEIRNCSDWRNYYVGQEIAVQRPKLPRNCLRTGGGAYGMSCSKVVSSQFSDWVRPGGGKIRTLPAGQYLVCASVDANNDGIMNDDEFFSETRIQINPRPQPYYPVQQTGGYPNQPYPNQPYPNPQYPNQPYPNQPYPNQQPYPYNTQYMGNFYGSALQLAPASIHWDGSSPIYY